jgi:hypothetical protein
MLPLPACPARGSASFRAAQARPGRKPKVGSRQQAEARRWRAREGAALKELARSYNVGKSTISRLAA